MNEKYDIIGDIHGYATKLKLLLKKLGYIEQQGIYRHPERRVIFLGDFIDRGPEIRETLRIVRAMVDGGSALAVMGNHEFNAMAYHTPNCSGGHLRAHTPEKIEQHRATMEQIATPFPGEWKVWLGWLATLPLYLDLGKLRAVHAAWDSSAVQAFQPIKKINELTLRAMVSKGKPLNRNRETLLNGMELRLPDGYYFSDKSGFERNDIRVRWWEALEGKTYREAAFPHSETVPDYPIPAASQKNLFYGPDEPPVFFGHYWLPPNAPKGPLTANVACLDYSVAKGGELTAYRWDGEQVLTADNFVGCDNRCRLE